MSRSPNRTGHRHPARTPVTASQPQPYATMRARPTTAIRYSEVQP